VNEYYKSHQKLSIIGVKGQQQFDNAKVLIIGAGGLGCPCLQSLVGCGIGTLGIADFDIISLSNLHRQTLFQFEDIGKNKVLVAASNLRKQNPFIKIVAHNLLVDDQNILNLMLAYT
jgi:molybdopterin/thiamine biosynthesis adenylyltransferase